MPWTFGTVSGAAKSRRSFMKGKWSALIDQYTWSLELKLLNSKLSTLNCLTSLNNSFAWFYCFNYETKNNLHGFINTPYPNLSCFFSYVLILIFQQLRKKTSNKKSWVFPTEWRSAPLANLTAFFQGRGEGSVKTWIREGFLPPETAHPIHLM